MLKYIIKILYKKKIVNKLSYNRLQHILSLLNIDLLNNKELKLRILDVGCANGKDFVQFFRDYHNLEIYGIDIKDYGIIQNNFSFVKCDAESIPFENDYFDLVISIGVLEHIKPIEKLSKIISEINRVSKKYCIVIPSINTLIEPHTSQLLWQLKDSGNKVKYNNLNYYSDESWLSFEGFRNAKGIRYKHLSFLISNLIIYKIT
jgi:ubiquinone/menaquinone biosynthesis C-methylase UbiE